MLVDGTNPELRTDASPRLQRNTKPRPPHFDLWASLLCVAVYGASIAIIWPVVELATDDDFAYAKMALAFARTGHFVFNGWETAIVGWQVVWGALFIRLFGYSYLTLRISTIILGAVLTLLLHRVLLRSGVTVSAATFGTLTLVLSPLFLPMATSYMTDVPALLCILLALYGCQRALRARSDRAALCWLCGSAALNVVDGTVRQVAWLGTLVIVPSAFWLLRGRRGFKTAGIISWVVSVAAIALTMTWFLHQPYTLPEHIIRGPIQPIVFWHMLRLSIYSPLEILCFSLPILVAWIFELRGLPRRMKLQILWAGAVAVPLIFWAAHFNKIQGRLPPWSANVVTRYGILWSIPLLGDRPQILPITMTSIIAAVLLASLAGFLIWLKSNARREWFHQAVHQVSHQKKALTLYETCVLILPFMAVYSLLLFPRAAFPSTFTDVFDRYYLPLIMAAIILLLRLLRKESPVIPVTCYTVLLLFSSFSIADTHDLFVAYRATAHARSQLEAAGIQSADISGPWQEDGANQILAQGYLNDDRLKNYQKLEHPELKSCHYWFGPLVPALHSHYVLTIEKLTCLTPSQYPDITYTTWLPPFQRTIYVERNPELPALR